MPDLGYTIGEGAIEPASYGLTLAPADSYDLGPYVEHLEREVEWMRDLITDRDAQPRHLNLGDIGTMSSDHTIQTNPFAGMTRHDMAVASRQWEAEQAKARDAIRIMEDQGYTEPDPADGDPHRP